MSNLCNMGFAPNQRRSANHIFLLDAVSKLC